MAAIADVLHVKGLDGAVKDITLYTDSDEIAGDYKEFKYNGQTVYVATITDGDVSCATDLCYKDADGVVHFFATKKSLATTTGTVSVGGALSADMTVNGNMTVSGAVTADVTASGTVSITGNITGTIIGSKTLYDCDIQVDGGTLAFASAVSESDGAMYTTGQLTNNSGVTAVIYGHLTVNGSVQYQLNNSGYFVVGTGGVVDITTSNGSSNTYGYAVRSTAGSFTVEAGGELIATTTASYSNAIYSSCPFTVYGNVTASAPEGSYADGCDLNGDTFTVASGGKAVMTGSRYGFYNYSSSTTQLIVENGGEFIAEGATYGFYGAVGSATIYGHFTGIGTGSSSYGIYNTVTFTAADGSEVEAVGVSYGLRNTSTANIGGKLTAEGTGTSGAGVYNSGGTFTLEDTGTIEAIGYLYGFYSTSTFNNYGTLVASISSEASSTYAVYQNSNFNIYDGGTVTAHGGARGWNNNGGTMTLNEGGVILAEGSLYGFYATGTLNLYGTLQATGETADFYCTGTTNLKGGTLTQMEA